MKKTFKFIITLIFVLIISGCVFKITPQETVEKFLNKYIRNDKEVLKELDLYLDEQNLTNEQKARYKRIIRDEYSTIKYKIKDETIDGKGAQVEVEIEVKNVYRAEKEAKDYLITYPKKFYSGEIYDSKKFIDYKLDKMEKADSSIIYTLYINLFLENDIWKIEKLDETTLKKIHGIYNYEQLN